MVHVTPIVLEGDERETLDAIESPITVAGLADKLGLSGEVEEIEAFIDSMLILVGYGLIERAPGGDKAHVRYQRTLVGHVVAGQQQ